MPDGSSARGGQQRLQPEIHRSNETQRFVLEAAPRSSATLCLPASGSALPQGAVRACVPGPPQPSPSPSPAGKAGGYEGC